MERNLFCKFLGSSKSAQIVEAGFEREIEAGFRKKRAQRGSLESAREE